MLQIVTLPTKSLRQKSERVDLALLKSQEVQKFIAEMVPAMYELDGVGLAAPQVGKNLQICVIGKDSDPSLPADLVLINPEWERISRKTLTDEEGCLSVPYVFGKVKRYKEITVNALDKNGDKLKFTAKDFFARVIQHEVDHLNGILFVDKARSLRKLTAEEIAEYQKERDSRKKNSI